MPEKYHKFTAHSDGTTIALKWGTVTGVYVADSKTGSFHGLGGDTAPGATVIVATAGTFKIRESVPDVLERIEAAP
jgi:hypothetical protein